MQTVQETEQLANREWGKGKLTEAKYEKYNQRIANAYQNASEQLASMKPQKRAKFLEKYNLSGTFDSNGYYIGQNTQKVGVNSNGNIVENNLSQDTKNASMLKEKTANDVLDTKNKTPATAEAKFSIKKDANGNEYVNIDTDQHIFDGKNVQESAKIAKQYIIEHFKNKDFDNISITSETAKKVNYPGRASTSERFVRSRVSTELDNLIKTGELIGTKNDLKSHKFAKDGFEYYKVKVKINNKDYEAILNVGKNGDVRTLYDVNNIREIKKGVPSISLSEKSENENRNIPKNGGTTTVNEKSQVRIVGQKPLVSPPSNSSIRNNSQNVNKNSQKSEKNIIKNEKSSENKAKNVQNSTNKAKITPKNNDVVPKQNSSKDVHTAEQAQNATAKYNRRAYSPRLWGKENDLVFKPTTKTFNAEQIEALDWFSSMNVHRNFADVVFTDELGARQNGAYSSGVIYISTKTKMPTKTALMHEMTHFIEGSKEYSNYARFVLDDLTSNDSILNKLNDISGNHWTVDEIVQAYTKQYGDKDAGAVISEVVAIYTSEYMFTDNFRLQQLANRNKNLFQKIFNFIRSIGYYFKNKVGKTAQEKEAYKFLNQAQKLYQQALDNIGTPLDIQGAKVEIDDNVVTRGTKVKDLPQNLKFSLNKYEIDNLGNKLTVEQSKFFKDSKVRDKDGNLLVVYHGSKSNITEFDSKFISKWNAYGNGFYFTSDKIRGERYAKNKLLETYINIRNPFYANNAEQLNLLYDKLNLKQEDILRFSEEEGVDGDDLFKLNYYASENDIDTAKAIQELGFDGVIINWKGKGIGNEYVVYNSNQIKEITNTNPTNSPDIRFSLNKNVDNDNTNGVNSNKGEEYGRERTGRMATVPSGDRDTSRSGIARLGRVQGLYEENRTREETEEYRQKDYEQRNAVKNFVVKILNSDDLKGQSYDRRDEIELIESVAKDANLTPIFCEIEYGTMAYRVYDDNIYLHRDVSPDEFGDILDVVRPYKTIPQERKYVGLSEARLQKIKERFPNAMLTRMRIDDFLKASGNEAIRRKIYSETAPLNVQDLQNVDSDMFLEVDLLSGKVISHEGRHRATALQQAGYTHIDIAVIPTTRELNILNNVYAQAQESDKTIVFNQLIPINNDLVKDKFVDRPSDLKYSLTKDEYNSVIDGKNATQSIKGYTSKELWERLTKYEQAQLYKAVDEIEHQGYYKYQLANGDYLIDIENKIIISDGNFDKPSIECIIEFDANSKKIEEARDYFYEIYNGRGIWECAQVINHLCKEEVATVYPFKNSGYDSKFSGKNDLNITNDGFSENSRRRAGVFDETGGTDGDGIKYSFTKGEHNKVVANYTRPKVYDKKEIKKIIDKIIDSELHINDYYGLVKAKDKDAVITKIFEDINKLPSKKLDAELEHIADSIIANAKYLNVYEEMADINIADYEAIKSYRKKLDLSGIEGEIRHRFDDKSQYVFRNWSAGQNGGVSVADAIAELGEVGVIIRTDNDADGFFEMLDIYDTLKSEINAKVKEYSADDLASNEISQMKEAIVNDLKTKLEEGGKKSKIQNIKEYFAQRIDYYKSEMRSSYAYSKALVKFKTSYDRFKALKNTPADEVVVPIVDKLTKAMQKTMTYTGNLNNNMRDILRNEFSPVHKQLIELSEQTDNPYIEVLAQIANAPFYIRTKKY